MAGLIIFDPENELAGWVTGDDVAVGTHLRIASDTLYFTDGVSIYAWGDDQDGYLQTYTWKSGEIRMPAPVNMGAAIVEAEDYSLTVGAVTGDLFWDDTVFATNFDNPGGNGATSDTEDARSVAATFNNSAAIINPISGLSPNSLDLRFKATAYASYGSVQADYDAYQMTNTDDFTIDGFIWMDSNPALEGTYTIISSSTTSARNFEINVSRPGATNDFELRMGNTVTAKFDINTELTLDTWHYFLVQRRYDGGAPKVDIYLGNASNPGGVNLATTVSYTGVPETVNASLLVGATRNYSTGSVEQYWDGYLDALRITKAARYPTVPASIPIPDTWYTVQGNTGATYDMTFKLYADDVLKHTQTVTSSEPFRLPGGYLSNIYSVEIVSALPVTRVSVAESIFELAEG